MSDALSQQITVAPITPATALVVCDAPFLHTLATIEREIGHMVLATPQDLQNASNYLQRLTTAGTKLEAARKKVKQPFLDKCSEIDAAARAPAVRIEAAKANVKIKVTAYDKEQQRLAVEAEKARQAELKRLEAIRHDEERVAQEKADELARLADEAAAQQKAKWDVPDFDDGDGEIHLEPVPPKTETELAIERVKFAPAVAAPKAEGVAWRTTLLIDSIDIANLPDIFVIKTANEKALRATFTQGYKEGDAMPECAGVKFRVHREPVSTGRAVF